MSKDWDYRTIKERPIKWILGEIDYIDLNPSYQRQGGIWSLKQKQLLIDSIINNLDIPKLYFHYLPKTQYSYAVIDGKQRIEAIIAFINNEYPLANDFKFLGHNEEKAIGNIKGKYYKELEKLEPAIAAGILTYTLTIVEIQTDDNEIIDEMFLRLNSGTPVNISEKRNASGGALSKTLLDVCAKSIFFVNKISIKNIRYSHFDLLLKLLMIEMGKTDLTKKSVDEFLIRNKDIPSECRAGLERVQNRLSKYELAFLDKDTLLKKKNIIITMYYSYDSIDYGYVREFLHVFEKYRKSGGSLFNTLDEYNKEELEEFTRLLQQGADKKNSLERRKTIMEHFFELFMNGKIG